MWVIETIFFIVIILYFIFGFFSFYWAMVGYPQLVMAKDVNDKLNESIQDVTKRKEITISILAKFLYHHGIAFIIGFTILALLLFAFGGGIVVARYVIS